MLMIDQARTFLELEWFDLNPNKDLVKEAKLAFIKQVNHKCKNWNPINHDKLLTA